MDSVLAARVATFTTSVVLHDDVVPRLTPVSVSVDVVLGSISSS